MQILVLGAAGKRSLGYSVSQRLLADGHTVAQLAGSPQEIRALSKQQLEAIDAIIDVKLPDSPESKEAELQRRPSLLRKMLKGSRRTLIMTSSVVVLGDTGPIPVGEDARLRTPRKFAWLPALETEILEAKELRGVVIRPAIEHYRSLSVAMGNCITLALRFREGKFIGAGTNCWSSVHPDDLADLYLSGTAEGCSRNAAACGKRNIFDEDPRGGHSSWTRN
jgi:nucleoside-diphosphate-sugar epimerase